MNYVNSKVCMYASEVGTSALTRQCMHEEGKVINNPKNPNVSGISSHLKQTENEKEREGKWSDLGVSGTCLGLGQKERAKFGGSSTYDVTLNVKEMNKHDIT